MHNAAMQSLSGAKQKVGDIMEKKIIVSETGYSQGWGSMPWKTVHGLTKQERQAVIDGHHVLITGCPLSGGGNGTGTTVREVYYKACWGRNRFHHKVPSQEVLAEAKERRLLS
jgi:hypothetical protein